MLGLIGVAGGCNICEPNDFDRLRPNMVVDPESAPATGGVAQDIDVFITITNNSGVPLNVFDIELTEDSDPAFEISEFPSEVH